MHNTKTLHEKIFAGQLTTAYIWFINSHGTQGVQHYAINSLLYLRTIKDKYVQMYNEFIKTVTHVCRGNKNFSKRVSANFTYNSFEIERNFRCSKNHNKINRSRLCYSYKKTPSLLWYEIGYFQHRQR